MPGGRREKECVYVPVPVQQIDYSLFCRSWQAVLRRLPLSAVASVPVKAMLWLKSHRILISAKLSLLLFELSSRKLADRQYYSLFSQ